MPIGNLPRKLGRVRRQWTVLLLAVASALAGCAGQPAQQGGQSSRVATSTADRMAAAALEAWGLRGNAPQALELIERAVAAEPQQAELTWLHIGLCLAKPGCDPAGLEARLRKLDPGNGVAWLGVLARAQARHDARAVASILEAMSGAQHFDLYWTKLVWRLTEVTSANKIAAGAPTQSSNLRQNAPLTSALNDVTGWLSRLATPAFAPLTAACDPQGKTPSTVSPACAGIAAALQRSDTTLAEGVGLGIAQRLATPGSPTARALEERAVTLGYRTQAAGAVMQTQLERDKFTAEVLELMRKLPREQDVSVAILRWARQPLAPDDPASRPGRPSSSQN